MINLIRKQLEDESYTVVNFHPWKTNSGKAMNQLFFDALKEGLKNKIWGINWQIDRYADALFQLDKTGLGKTIWQLFFQPDSVEKQKDKLAESMKLLDKNLVVVVDDLDRLAKNEIADVLKLMRDTANFPNLVFIAAYDRNYLNEAIKEEINEHNYENYMDKIVLWEVPIYKPQPRKYIEILKNLLIERLSEFS
ncbi:MAG: P-loop NTPase fold protein, partial [Bacteroidota bacterium]|nr:P-loop NTPase fold protein [Bacteroidota bacterium]